MALIVNSTYDPGVPSLQVASGCSPRSTNCKASCGELAVAAPSIAIAFTKIPNAAAGEARSSMDKLVLANFLTGRGSAE